MSTGKSKFLVFQLSNERYAVPLNKVKEVIRLAKITHVPHVPTFFKGIINLRGKIISVMDLRAKMGLAQEEYKPKQTCIVITEVDGMTLGAIVDDVLEVAGYEAADVESTLDIQSEVARDFVIGVAKREGDLTLLLDIGKTLDVEALSYLRKQEA